MRLPPLLIAACVALAGCAAAPIAPAVSEAPPPPAANYAWASFDSRGITGSGAYGLADRGTGRPLSIDDPVRIASITKLHVALGVMRMVEAGKLDLDRDVSDWLGWKLRNPAFPDEPITLRLLLSHRSSLRDGINYAIPSGTTLRQAILPPEAYDREHPPGTFFRYSNLNFPVIASVMEAASHERFDRLMDRLVLKPLRMDACFNWTTCGESRLKRAVVLYAPDGSVLRDDLKGERPACPIVPAADGSCELESYRLASNGALFSPQGGLRVSVRDLVRTGRLLLGRGRSAEGMRFLSETSMAELSRIAWRYDGANGDTEGKFYCGYGLAVQILGQCPPGDDPFADGRVLIGHAGDAYGLRSGLWVDGERGVGIAYFATGLGDDPPRGRSAYRAVEEWLAAKTKQVRR